MNVKAVHNNYRNFQNLLQFVNDRQVETIKKCFQISTRKMCIITNINNLQKMLEKLGELDEFHIQPFEVISERLDEPLKSDMKELIKLHKTLISKCNNVGEPVFNQYAKEILNNKSEYKHKSNIISESINESNCNINSGSSILHNTQRSSNSNQYFEAIDLISQEIGNRWKDLARYLRLQEHEIEEIDQSQKFLRDKARKTLQSSLNKELPANVKRVIEIALIKTRRKDLVKRVMLLL